MKTRPGAGRVIWITGLAGSGKTTVATALVPRLRQRGAAVVLLDGDELRRTIATDLGYDLTDRRAAAERYARLARALALQGLTVVVATISMFESVRRWNRRRMPRYCEVYLRRAPGAPFRRRRRPAGAARLEVGVDLPFEEPRHPDLVFDDATANVAAVVARIARSVPRGR